MNHAKLYDNFKDKFDCEKLTSQLKKHKGVRRSSDIPTEDTEYGDKAVWRKTVGDLWKSVGYTELDSVEWWNLYSGEHFDSDFVTQFENLVNADKFMCWVSSINPGKCVPNHYDIVPEYSKLKDDPKMVRFAFFIDKPETGKVFIIKDQAFHMCNQGDCYVWNKWDEWHMGMNTSSSIKYIWNFIGLKRKEGGDVLKFRHFF